MRILVLTQDYPRLDGTHERFYVHVRNVYYLKNNISVDVLNFSTNNNYVIDGINVISEKDYYDKRNQYDLLIVHAPNIRNHYRFLKKNEKKFNHIVFFFHGHEIMRLTKDYPKPYSYLKSSRIVYSFFRNIYDEVKIALWKNYFKKLNYKSEYVFVSKYLYKKYYDNFKMNYNKMKSNEHIINNSVGKIFEKQKYDPTAEKKYDFITIRSNIDGSTYCIDLLVKIANKYPNKKFLLIGKGKYFKYTKQPQNLLWINKTINHSDMIQYLNASKIALQLTRHDTQGVMSCELATYGIPLITSDIDVCKEIFKDFKNVAMISNDIDNIDLDKIIEALKPSTDIIKEYYEDNTIKNEVDLFYKIIQSGGETNV